MVEVAARIALVIDHKAQRVPRQIHVIFVTRPIPKLAWFTFPVGAHIVRLFLGFIWYMLRRSELETGVLRIAVELDWPNQTGQPRGKLDQRAAGYLISGQLTLFFGKDRFVLAMPGDCHAVPTDHGPRRRLQDFDVFLAFILFAMPDVRPLAIAVADAVETKEEPAVMRVQAARALGQQLLTSWIVNVVVDLVGLAEPFFAGPIGSFGKRRNCELKA